MNREGPGHVKIAQPVRMLRKWSLMQTVLKIGGGYKWIFGHG
jgi:hypothetical protein